MTDLLDPCNDVVFKLLFARHTELLVDLINTIREHSPPIREVMVRNPGIAPEEPQSKFIVLDIRATDERGSHYDIEMQVRREIAYGARSAYYLAKLLTEQLERGEEYAGLRPAIGIHLLHFELFPQGKQSHYHFQMRDGADPSIMLGPELQLHVLEMRKMDRDGKLTVAMHDWIQFFEHAREEREMQKVEHPAVIRALAALKQLSEDEEARRLAFVRERALRDEASALAGARREGREEGWEEGRREEARAVVWRQLQRRFGPLSSAHEERIAAMSIEVLEALAEEFLDFSGIGDLAAWLERH